MKKKSKKKPDMFFIPQSQFSKDSTPSELIVRADNEYHLASIGPDGKCTLERMWLETVKN